MGAQRALAALAAVLCVCAVVRYASPGSAGGAVALDAWLPGDDDGSYEGGMVKAVEQAQAQLRARGYRGR
eukprot:CAMPEP_0173391570 /NCGR_PEP_ID=MMETSP1356-20130122/18462_1 /TAXON_ID=77927 ORGANISM="Hemiselmis virescens, Strain PCC157" /NCGR_SAMPLE_ID=MMETSP1356 /ASSEMBLY_ACC=CAM_ASM_000847 /LENGTH=69 /DNA_ID=CAMNT_0014349223 /DNA_START=24 /DNA_END=229 /DNA_ORIENTATION=+